MNPHQSSTLQIPSRAILQNIHHPNLVERLLRAPSSDPTIHQSVAFTQYGFFPSHGASYTPNYWWPYPTWLWYSRAILCLLFWAIPHRLIFEIQNLLRRPLNSYDARQRWAFWQLGQVPQWLLYNLGLMFGYNWTWLGIKTPQLKDAT